MRTIVRLLVAVPLVLGWAFVGAGSIGAASGSQVIYVLPTTGVVDGVMAGYIEAGIDEAERDGAAAVVIELNTPGGAMDAMQRIVMAELNATVPTIVWVGPAGAKAASAGTFITLAANLAYMDSSTNIGAASPIDSSGNDIQGTLGQKVKNDAIASIRSIASRRGHNVDWAESTVATAVSSEATVAVQIGAVNGLANSLDDLRVAATGRAVTLGDGRTVTLDLSQATFQDLPMNPFQQFLHLLADPNIAFILFTLGFYGLLFELQSPNFVTGILGAFAIVLAFIGFGSLPLNVAGLLLIGLGILLFILEATVTSHGLLTAGGLVAFLLGASALYTEPGSPAAPDVSVALPLILTMAALSGILFGFIAVTAVRSRRLATSPVLVGAPPSTLVGEQGRVGRPLSPVGSVWAGGEEWTARMADGGTLGRGAPVRIVARDGLTLVVENREESVGETDTRVPGQAWSMSARESAASLEMPARPGPSRPQVQH